VVSSAACQAMIKVMILINKLEIWEMTFIGGELFSNDFDDL
jgi:hypothetical protein